MISGKLVESAFKPGIEISEWDIYCAFLFSMDLIEYEYLNSSICSGEYRTLVREAQLKLIKALYINRQEASDICSF